MPGILGQKPFKSCISKSRSSEVCGPIHDLSSSGPAGRCGAVSTLHLDHPYLQGEIHVGYHELLPKHLETDGLQMSQAEDGTAKLESAHNLHTELLVSQLINA